MRDRIDHGQSGRHLGAATEMQAMPHDTAASGGPRFRDILAALRHRWWLLAITAILGIGLARVLVKREIPQYVGAALIRMVDERSLVTGSLGDPATSGSFQRTSEWIQSQILVLLSRGVAGQVVDREGLRLSSLTPEFPRGRLEDVRIDLAPEETDSVLVRFRHDGMHASHAGISAEANYGDPVQLGAVSFVIRERPPIDELRLHIVSREAAIDATTAGFTAWARTGTDAIDLRYTSTDPRLAVRLVNAYANTFRDENARFAQEQTARRSEFLEGQLEQNGIALRAAQQALIQFRKDRKLYSSAQRIQVEHNTLVSLDTRREELDADRRLFSSMLARAQAAEGEEHRRLLDALVNAPGLGDNPQIAQVRGDVLTSRSNLRRLRAELTDLHPEVKKELAILEQAEVRLVTAVEMQIASMQSRVAALDELRERTAARLEPLPAAEAEELRLVEDVESARLLGEQLRAEYQRVRTTQAVEGGQVSIVNLAARPTSGNRHPWVKMGIGAGVGLLMGIALALLLDMLNGTVRQQDEISTLLRIPHIGFIPRADVVALRPKRRRLNGANGKSANGNRLDDSHNLVTAASTNSVGSEAYRTLRTTLMFSDSLKGLKTLVVTSACIGDGKTTVVANLAISLAQQDLRVLLIDADLRRPRLHDLFNEPRYPGLTDLLECSPDGGHAIRQTHVTNLHLITSGTMPRNPSELVGGRRMHTLIETLKNEYDFVLLDAPPVMGAADPVVVAARVDGVLFLVRAGHTGREVAQRAIEQLELVGARVVGAVLNDPDSVAVRYGRPYGYGYAYATDD